MANLHVRSNSLPSKSHPVVNDVQNCLHRLRSSEGTSTSVCQDLARLRDLHEGIENLIQMPSIQQALATESGEKWANELLEESLRLMDLCGFTTDILSLSKGSIQELQSTMRRSRGDTSMVDVMIAYTRSRKKINKIVNKFLKSLNKMSTPFSEEDSDIRDVYSMLKDTVAFDFSVLKSVLKFLSGEEGKPKKRSRSLFSLFTQTSRENILGAADVQSFSEQLKSSEATIQELEEEMEALHRTLVKARVSLLNALSHQTGVSALDIVATLTWPPRVILYLVYTLKQLGH